MNQLFVTSHCPDCGRANQFPIDALGRRSSCHHCAQVMTVRDKDSFLAGDSDSIAWWLRFTESGSRMSPEFELPEKTLPR